MQKFENIVNWNNIHAQAQNFQNNKPFKFAFIEEFFVRDFYEKLYNEYPSLDSFFTHQDLSKCQLYRNWNNETGTVSSGPDPAFSDTWNTLKLYAESEEFISNMRHFSGVPVNKLKKFKFMAYRKGGFQLAHTHDVGPSTLIFMLYFSKGWKKGEPGGTFMTTEDDESKIIFEPYNLDNSVAVFHDSSNSSHGTRYITQNAERRAFQITLEEYHPKNGWTGRND